MRFFYLLILSFILYIGISFLKSKRYCNKYADKIFNFIMENIDTPSEAIIEKFKNSEVNNLTINIENKKKGETTIKYITLHFIFRKELMEYEVESKLGMIIENHNIISIFNF